MGNENYKILGVSENASIKEIKKAYKKLSKKWHPDVNSSPEATTMMQKINNAYQWLLKNHIHGTDYQSVREEKVETEPFYQEKPQPETGKKKWQNPYERYKYEIDSIGYLQYLNANIQAMLDGLI